MQRLYFSINILLALLFTLQISGQITTYTNPIFESGYDAKASFKDGYYYYVKWSQGKVEGVDNYIYRTKNPSNLGTPVALPVGAPLSPPIYIGSLYGHEVNKWFLFGQGLWQCDGDPYTGTWTNIVGDLYKQVQYRLDFYPFFYKGELFVAWAGSHELGTYDWGFESVFVSKVNYDGSTFSLEQTIAGGGNMVATFSFGYGQRPLFSTSGVVVEAPAVYTPSMFGIEGREDEMFMLLSINGANTNMYAISMIYFTGNSPSQVSSPDYWKKVDDNGDERLYASNNGDQTTTSLYDKGIKGPGVAALVPSPDNSKLYMYYHSKHNDGFHNGNTAFEWERRLMFQEIGWRTFDGKMIPDFHAKPIIGVGESAVVELANALDYWEFVDDTEGWTISHHLTSEHTQGQLDLSLTGNDPYIHSPSGLNLAAEDYPYVVVGLRNQSSATKGEIFWVTDQSGNWEGAKRLSFDIVPQDDRIRYYVIDMSAHAEWKDVIKQFRIDPTTGTDQGGVILDVVKLTDSYGSSPVMIPGILQVEDFNKGGKNNAYKDNDLANNGGQYRTDEGVDIEVSGLGGYNVGWIDAGEWMDYLVEVTSDGDYQINIKAAVPGSSANIKLLVDGMAVSNDISLAGTGGWQTYGDNFVITGLAAGLHYLRIEAVAAGYNADFLQFEKVITTGVENSECTDRRVYPNPTNGQFEFRDGCRERDRAFVVMDILGNQIARYDFMEGRQYQLPNNLASGVYFLMVDNTTTLLRLAR